MIATSNAELELDFLSLDLTFAIRRDVPKDSLFGGSNLLDVGDWTCEDDPASGTCLAEEVVRGVSRV